jgi:hypothetical protein
MVIPFSFYGNAGELPDPGHTDAISFGNPHARKTRCEPSRNKFSISLQNNNLPVSG